jgi:hypothetical protein
MRRAMVLVGVVLPLVLGAWPGGSASAGIACPVPLPWGGDPVTLDSAGFVGRVDNPYWPMAPGTRWIYLETDAQGGRQRVVVEVLWHTKQIEGIAATVVHDRVLEHGELVENTVDWYAQDVCGNVWYLGENTKEYEEGKVVTTAGSWRHGRDGAQAGVIMPANPQVGMRYRQEYLAGQAEDAAKVLSRNEQAQVPYGHFWHVLLTKEFTPLAPEVLEYKMYTRGVGPVMTLAVSGGSDQERLISVRRPS